MPVAPNPNSTFDYVLKCDRDKPVEDQTVFKLSVLNAAEYAEIEDSTVVGDREHGFRTQSGSTILRVLRLGLRGWSNLRNEEGEEVTFATRTVNGGRRGAVQQPTDETLSRLLPAWRRELCNAITEGNTVDEDEAGK